MYSYDKIGNVNNLDNINYKKIREITNQNKKYLDTEFLKNIILSELFNLQILKTHLPIEVKSKREN